MDVKKPVRVITMKNIFKRIDLVLPFFAHIIYCLPNLINARLNLFLARNIYYKAISANKYLILL